MGEAQVFEFIITDGGGSAPPTAGAAARSYTPVPSAPQAPPSARGDGVPVAGRAGRGEAADDRLSLAKIMGDAMQKATRYSTLAPFGAAGSNLLRPLHDFAKVLDDLRGIGAGRAKPGAAASSSPLPISRPAGPAVQSLTISQAVINAAGARILITGGDVVVAGRAGGGVGGVPRLPGLAGPRRLPSIGRGTVPIAGAAARTSLSVAGSAGGAAAIGGAAAAAAIPLAAVAVVAGAAALAIKGLYNRANENAKAFAHYDATLAAATARAQVAGIQQDLRSARYLGKELAEFTKAQSDLKVAWQQRIDEFEKVFLPIATKAIELLTRIIGKADELKKDDPDISDFFALFESYNDLDINSKEGRLGAPGGFRPQVVAPGFGDIPMP